MQTVDTTTALVDRYFAAWNETDAAERDQLITGTWAEDGTYLDPVMGGEGHAGIAAMIAGFGAQFPGLRFQRDSGRSSPDSGFIGTPRSTRTMIACAFPGCSSPRTDP